jgi:hypothetical protein
MTAGVSPGAELDVIVSRTRWLLLAFDGPVCSVSTMPAPYLHDVLTAANDHH